MSKAQPKVIDRIHRRLAANAGQTPPADKRLMYDANREMIRMAERLAELEAIVAKLPIDDEGNPIVPGDVKFALNADGDVCETLISLGGQDNPDPDYSGDWYALHPDAKFWNTSDAAEAAKTEGE